MFYTSLHQTTAGEVTGAQQRDGAAFFHVDSVFFDVYLREDAKIYLAVGHEAEMMTVSSGEAFWGAHMHPAMGICAGAPCRSAAAHRDWPPGPLLCRISRCRPLAHRYFFEQGKAVLSLNSNYFLNSRGTSEAKENLFALPGSPKIASN